MAYICPSCGRTVEKLIELDDAETTLWQSETTGVPWTARNYFCVTCAREVLGITDQDLIREERLLANNTEFHLNLVKGRLAQILVEAIFLEFGYEVYPFGYESYLTNIIKFMRKGTANIPARKIRASPDLFVYDREANDGYLVEVKATSTRDESHYWISQSVLGTYHTHWPEAMLLVYCISTGNIYCKQICEINTDELPVEQSPANQWQNYVLNLEKDFHILPDCFRLIEKNRYAQFAYQLRKVLSGFYIGQQ